MLVYCDSVILIYYLEGTPTFRTRARARLHALWAAGDVVATSDLVRLECRMHPLRAGNARRLADFDNLFNLQNVRLLPITSAVFDRATLLRATHNFKLADSLHLACAAEGTCDRILTNDTRLSAFAGVPVEVLP